MSRFVVLLRSMTAEAISALAVIHVSGPVAFAILAARAHQRARRLSFAARSARDPTN